MIQLSKMESKEIKKGTKIFNLVLNFCPNFVVLLFLDLLAEDPVLVPPSLNFKSKREQFKE
jgi:hypothetical protein